VKGIIGLPANLFYGTGIPACIIVLDKENAASRKGIFMIDASKGFIKDGNKNRLRAQDIHKIVDAFTRQLEIDRYSRMVPLAEISDPKNDFNLNLPRYIDSTEPEDLQDIDAHLRGGIPDRDIDDLERYWQVFPAVRAVLFERADRPGYSQLRVAVDDIKTAILGHAEFTAFNQSVIALFVKWEKANIPHLKGIAIGGHPKVLIESLSEDLLETFRQAPLLDPYDLYQHLMNYWAETMQDDSYLLAQAGWKAVADGRPNIELIPQSLIIRRYFAVEQEAIEKLETERDGSTSQMEEMEEENAGQSDDGGGLLFEAKTEKGKLTKISVNARLKDIKHDKDYADERKALEGYLAFIEKESVASKQVKDAQKALEAKVAAKFARLTEDEIKTLVVHDKWLANLAAAVQSELDRVTQALTGRIRQLAERYATPLSKLTEEVASLAARVDEHLKEMGTVWK
jgi:type I restriction enzyme M protein